MFQGSAATLRPHGPTVAIVRARSRTRRHESRGGSARRATGRRSPRARFRFACRSHRARPRDVAWYPWRVGVGASHFCRGVASCVTSPDFLSVVSLVVPHSSLDGDDPWHELSKEEKNKKEAALREAARASLSQKEKTEKNNRAINISRRRSKRAQHHRRR